MRPPVIDTDTDNHLDRLRSLGRSLYGILGVPRTASPPEIRRAFRKLALRTHPDKTGGGGGYDEFLVAVLSRAPSTTPTSTAAASWPSTICT